MSGQGDELTPPAHHKEVARFLASQVGGAVRVTAFRDNSDARPIPIGEFGAGSKRLCSTIGAFDLRLRLPDGDFEFAAYGGLKWLPNALTSSVYWLDERTVSEWPLVCEDVVRHNARSRYRHMAYVPSARSLRVSTGQEIRWLLGVPISDREIGVSLKDVLDKARRIYPGWLLQTGS